MFFLKELEESELVPWVLPNDDARIAAATAQTELCRHTGRGSLLMNPAPQRMALVREEGSESEQGQRGEFTDKGWRVLCSATLYVGELVSGKGFNDSISEISVDAPTIGMTFR